MKEIKIERTVYDTMYEAVDGSTFYDRDECEKYEKTAECAITKAYNKTFGVTCKSGIPLPDIMSFVDQDKLYAIKIENEHELEVFNRWVAGGHGETLGADAIGKTHIIQNSWEENFYYIGTVDEFKEWLNAFTDELEATAKCGESEGENENNQSAD